MHESGQERLPQLQQLGADGADVADQRGVEAFEDVGVGFEGQRGELGQFPVRLFHLALLEVVGGALEGPQQLGGSDEHASDVDVGAVLGEAVGLAAGDAAVDDPVVEELPHQRRRVAHRAEGGLLGLLADPELVAAQHHLVAGGIADPVGNRIAVDDLDDDTGAA